MEQSDIPLPARVELAHAEIQAVARAHDVDTLLVKGYAADPRLYVPGRVSSDVDVLTRPSQAKRLVHALETNGWETISTFTSGSIFQHAQTMRHPSWGLVDVHRSFPGFETGPGDLFEQLWAGRVTRAVAGFPCDVPGSLDHALIIVVHAARSPEAIHQDVGHLAAVLTDRDWTALARRAQELDASVAFAAATGRLARYRDHPTHDLWLSLSQDGTRSQEWRARFKAATSARVKLQLALRAPLPNVDHLRMDLGREPTVLDIAAATARRPLTAVTELFSGRAAPRPGPGVDPADTGRNGFRGPVPTDATPLGVAENQGGGSVRRNASTPQCADPTGETGSAASLLVDASAQDLAGAGPDTRITPSSGVPEHLRTAADVAWVDLSTGPAAPEGVYVAKVPGGAPLVLNDSAALIWRHALRLPEARVADAVAEAVGGHEDAAVIQAHVDQFLSRLVADGFVER